jgi:hypothetical protein
MIIRRLNLTKLPSIFSEISRKMNPLTMSPGTKKVQSLKKKTVPTDSIGPIKDYGWMYLEWQVIKVYSHHHSRQESIWKV